MIIFNLLMLDWLPKALIKYVFPLVVYEHNYLHVCVIMEMPWLKLTLVYHFSIWFITHPSTVFIAYLYSYVPYLELLSPKTTKILLSWIFSSGLPE